MSIILKGRRAEGPKRVPMLKQLVTHKACFAFCFSKYKYKNQKQDFQNKTPLEINIVLPVITTVPTKAHQVIHLLENKV